LPSEGGILPCLRTRQRADPHSADPLSLSLRLDSDEMAKALDLAIFAVNADNGAQERLDAVLEADHIRNELNVTWSRIGARLGTIEQSRTSSMASSIRSHSRTPVPDGLASGSPSGQRPGAPTSRLPGIRVVPPRVGQRVRLPRAHGSTRTSAPMNSQASSPVSRLPRWQIAPEAHTAWVSLSASHVERLPG
jgi:hypothetical protein